MFSDFLEERYILFSKSGFTDGLKDISDTTLDLFSLEEMEEKLKS